ARIAEQWHGGQYRVLENKKKDHHVLLYVSEWSDAAAAAKVFEAWRTVMQKKWKRFEVRTGTAAEVTGIGDDGAFRLQLAGARVTSVEGLPD
ncbi:MAG: hypothetical protein JNL62_28750, partial [Bryobacterales bacterium]|nr:hypothetical protein [Bryobacterales bacterium]